MYQLFSISQRVLSFIYEGFSNVYSVLNTPIREVVNTPLHELGWFGDVLAWITNILTIFAPDYTTLDLLFTNFALLMALILIGWLLRSFPII